MRLLPLFALTLGACADTPLPADLVARHDEAADVGPTDSFDQAARATGVPAELLMAIASVETGFQMVVGEVEFDGMEPAVGLMGLRGENLSQGAELAGLTLEQVATLRDANVLAAATLLAAWAEEEGIDSDDLDAWAPLVARYSGIENPEGAAEYVHFDVYGALRNGMEAEGILVPAIDVAPDFPLPSRQKNVRKDDAAAVWSASPNWSSRSGYTPKFVIIHTCEGSYSGCWGWLSNPAAGASAHYVVNELGTEVRQLVDEANKAWHVAATYYCSNNSNKECGYNGVGTNNISVGIEHAGYASQSTWNNGLLDRSAALTCGITKRHGITRDSYHIVGHGQLQPYNRTDPGPNWPWTDYINRVKTACGDPGTSGSTGSSSGSAGSTGLPSQFVIDSNNGANTTADFKIEVGSAWWASTSTPGYWNTGYWVTKLDPSSNLASFKFQADASQCWQVEGWWTAGGNRATGATFIAYDSADRELGRAVVNQQVNGGKWNVLGKWTFPSGWNRVSLSRWGSGEQYVVADALRLTATTGCTN